MQIKHARVCVWWWNVGFSQSVTQVVSGIVCGVVHFRISTLPMS